jgi:endogenous inhibitor of DNA gyrase (YacG/DUF329 family)
MIRGRCPTCSKAYEISALADLPAFPFCTERCRLIDLGRWIDEKHAIPARESDEREADEGASGHEESPGEAAEE